MSVYEVKFIVKGKNLRLPNVKKEMEEKLGHPVIVTKVNLTPSRKERLAMAEALVGEAHSMITDLADEIQNWFDNLPESFQSTDKGEAIQQCSDSLTELLDCIESIEFDNIEFPSAYGG